MVGTRATVGTLVPGMGMVARRVVVVFVAVSVEITRVVPGGNLVSAGPVWVAPDRREIHNLRHPSVKFLIRVPFRSPRHIPG